MRKAIETTVARDGIRLDLVPLLSMYGRNRRLSLRVERLPERARLSRGRNNGDRSWSLMRDDLDDLLYLPPDGMKSSHTLAVRIVSLDTNDGATLAVFEVPIAAEQFQSPKPAAVATTETTTEPELPLLREECARMRAELGQRENELAETRQALEGAQALASSRQEALVAARAEWQSELDRRLADAQAESAAKLGTSRAAWLADTNARIEQARAGWQREAESALTRAKEAWRAEESARLAEAESQWRDNAAHALSEARAQTARVESALARAEAEAARLSGDGAALRRLREEIAEAQALLAARGRELADTREALEQARAEAIAGKAEIAAARAAWQAEMERRIAAARAEALAHRDTSVLEDRAQTRIDEAREQWRLEADAALARAREDWKSDEALRFARAEAQWRQESAKALADSAARIEKAETALARAQAHALHESADAVELRRVRDELSETRAVLLDREARLAQARQEMKKARERWKSEADVALKNAQEAWKAEEQYRISVARGDWHRDFRVAREAEEKVVAAPPRNNRRLVLDGILAAALALAAFVLYPMIAPTLEQYWPDTISPVPARDDASARVSASSTPPPPSAPALRQELIVHTANVHADPSAAGAIVARLARGLKVTPLEQRGSWVRVRVGDGHGTKEGWVFDRYLKDSAG